MTKISARWMLRPLLLGCAAALVAGCAGQKTSEAAKPLAAEKSAVEKVDAAMANGSQIKNEKGEKLYCRKELQTGSHARSKTKCLTQREWDQVAETTRESVRDMTKRQKPPSGS